MPNITNYQRTENQNYNDTNSYFSNAGKKAEEKEPLHTVGGNVNRYSRCGNRMEGPQKIILYDPVISLTEINRKETKLLSERGTSTSMLIAPLFTITKI